MGSGEVVPEPAAPQRNTFASERFQWLPADINVDADSGAVRFKSYVNNLHPERHAALYAALARLLSRLVPMFERTLTRAPYALLPVALLPDLYWWDPPEPLEPLDGVVEDPYGHWMDTRKLIGPSLPVEVRPPAEGEGVPVRLRGRTLQVIVKVAEIVLTPEAPKYPGGTWHVEGMANESIVASAICYVGSENISVSRLRFRAMVHEPGYEQNGALCADALCSVSMGRLSHGRSALPCFWWHRHRKSA
jgi:Protein of unknown function (DUF4246)